MNKFFLAALGAIAMVSCAEPPATEEVVTAPATLPAATAAAPVSDSPVNTINNIQPTGNTITVSPNQAQPAAPATVNANAKGLNPEHGKPGHRCDIPVGAPLNSPAGGNAQPVQQVQPVATPVGPSSVGPQITPIQPAPSALPAASGKRVNPPHGEPGHDCAKPVGAPLD